MKRAKWIAALWTLIIISIPSSDAQEPAKAGESAAGIIEKAILDKGLDAAVQKFKELRSTTRRPV